MKNFFVLISLILAIHTPYPIAAASASLPFHRGIPQQKGMVIGYVKDKITGESLSFATVSLRDEKDEVTVGAITEKDGSFTLSNIAYGQYVFHIHFMGYKELSFPLTVNSPKKDLNVLEMEENSEQLEGTIVTAKVPVLEQKLDKIVMNVSETVSAQGSNALELLRKAPGVSIDTEGNVKLNGQTVDIWIDGRPSYLSGSNLKSLLESTDGITIDKFEIMAHPSAKYDASGSGGIINIKTKKNFMKGLNGSLSSHYGGMYFDRFEQQGGGTVNLNYRGEKTNSTILYSGNYNEIGSEMNGKTWLNIKDADAWQKSYSKLRMSGPSHNVKLTNDWFQNDKNTFGMLFNYNYNHFTQQNIGDDNHTQTIIDGEIVRDYTSKLKTSSSFSNASGNLNWTHIFNQNKNQEITVNADYLYYDISSANNQLNSLVGGTTADDMNVHIHSNQYINILSGKADYQQDFWNGATLELGGKWAFTQTNNHTLDNDKPNDYLYKENIGAVYATAGKTFDFWSFKAGLRGELTLANGDWISTQKKTNKSYFNLFPTLFLGYNPNMSWRFNLSYSRRITRPGFEQLNPFKSYMDATSFTVGNPYLSPQFSHQIQFATGYKTHYNLSLLYSHTRNLIIQVPEVDQQTGYKNFMYDNFGSQNMLGATLAVTELHITKWFVLNLNGTLVYVTNKNNTSDGEYKRNGLMTALMGTTTFFLPKDFKIELMGIFIQPGTIGYFETSNILLTTAGVKKNILKGKGTLALNVMDPFRSFRSKLTTYNASGVRTYHIRQNINLQRITFSFNFRFGESKYIKTRKVGKTEEADRVGTGGLPGTATPPQQMTP